MSTGRHAQRRLARRKVRRVQRLRVQYRTSRIGYRRREFRKVLWRAFESMANVIWRSTQFPSFTRLPTGSVTISAAEMFTSDFGAFM